MCVRARAIVAPAAPREFALVLGLVGACFGAATVMCARELRWRCLEGAIISWALRGRLSSTELRQAALDAALRSGEQRLRPGRRSLRLLLLATAVLAAGFVTRGSSRVCQGREPHLNPVLLRHLPPVAVLLREAAGLNHKL